MTAEVREMAGKSRFFIFVAAAPVLFIAASAGPVYAQTATPLSDSAATAISCFCCCLPVVLVFTILIIVLAGMVSLKVMAGNKPPASPPVPPSPRPLAWPRNTRANPPVVRSTVVYKEKEIIREIVKVPCDYCGSLVDVTSEHCPSCGAPFKSR